jgi:hypothetical protein
MYQLKRMPELNQNHNAKAYVFSIVLYVLCGKKISLK